MERADWHYWNDKVSAIDFIYVKNGKQQKIWYFIRLCMTGEVPLIHTFP